MFIKNGPEREWYWNNDEHILLPMMTAFFVDGLTPMARRRSAGMAPRRHQRGLTPYASGSPGWSKVMVKASNKKERSTPWPAIHDEQWPAEPDTRLKVFNPVIDYAAKQRAIRTLIGGLSHHFNNLLMGIWGNVSLMALSVGRGHSCRNDIDQMEKLVQSGAFMNNLVLGYLGERRTNAKRIRLNQLITEMTGQQQSAASDEHRLDLEARLQWASRVKQPRLVAGSAAQVFHGLLQGIAALTRHVAQNAGQDAKMKSRVATIQRLTHKGAAINRQLMLYTGDMQGEREHTDLAELVSACADRFGTANPAFPIDVHLGAGLLNVHCNPGHLSQAIEQILKNAVQALPENGHLSIDVRSLIAEAPSDRFSRDGGRQQLVITIKDTGCGMNRQIQSQAFDPFFTTDGRRRRKGLGLAVAAGIVRSHDGYIRIRSTPGQGTEVKIYLPQAEPIVHLCRLSRGLDGTTASCHV